MWNNTLRMLKKLKIGILSSKGFSIKGKGTLLSEHSIHIPRWVPKLNLISSKYHIAIHDNIYNIHIYVACNLTLN